MENYFSALSNLFKDWKAAIVTAVFTVLRLIVGWTWIKAGWHKLEWLSDGKLNSQGLIHGMINNLVGTAEKPATHFDPLHLNNLFAWVADHIFLGMPAVTDFLVVMFEIGIGVLLILGYRVFWVALAAMFMNTQFITAGSANNFGYIWTNLAIMAWARYFDAIGVSGFLRVRKGKDLIHNLPTPPGNKDVPKSA